MHTNAQETTQGLQKSMQADLAIRKRLKLSPTGSHLRQKL